jgi:hypothetical protein
MPCGTQHRRNCTVLRRVMPKSAFTPGLAILPGFCPLYPDFVLAGFLNPRFTPASRGPGGLVGLSPGAHRFIQPDFTPLYNTFFCTRILPHFPFLRHLGNLPARF